MSKRIVSLLLLSFFSLNVFYVPCSNSFFPYFPEGVNKLFLVLGSGKTVCCGLRDAGYELKA